MLRQRSPPFIVSPRCWVIKKVRKSFTLNQGQPYLHCIYEQSYLYITQHSLFHRMWDFYLTFDICYTIVKSVKSSRKHVELDNSSFYLCPMFIAPLTETTSSWEHILGKTCQTILLVSHVYNATNRNNFFMGAHSRAM